MEINPYTEWLAIPPSQTPPSHYRLLGLKDFEADREKVQRAALDQLARLRVHQVGIHVDLTQTLMNEISLARIVLCDPNKKSEYDRILRKGGEDRPAPPVARKERRPRPAPFVVDSNGNGSDEPSEDFKEIVDVDSLAVALPYHRQWISGPLRTVLRAAVGTVMVLGLVVAAAFLSRISWQKPSATTADSTESSQPDLVESDDATPAADEVAVAPTVPVPSGPTHPEQRDATGPLRTPKQPNAIRQPQVSNGFEKIWESKFLTNSPEIAILENDTVAYGPQGLRLELEGPGRRSIFGPGNIGDFGLHVHVGEARIQDGQQLLIGGLDANDNFVGASIQGRPEQRTVAFVGPPDEVAGTVVDLDVEGAFWVGIFRRHEQWWVQVRRDDDGEVHEFARYRLEFHQPLVLTVALENHSAQPTSVVVDHLWIEARNQDVLARYKQWPNVVTIPNDRIDASIVGKFLPQEGGQRVLEVDFNDDAQIAAWGGENVGNGGVVRLQAGQSVSLGPIAFVQAVELKPARSVEHLTRMTMEFDNGLTVDINFETEQATVEGKKIADFRRNGDLVPIRLYELEQNGQVKEGSLRFDTTSIPLGSAKITVDQGEIELDFIRVKGEVDVRRLWLHELGGVNKSNVAGVAPEQASPEPQPDKPIVDAPVEAASAPSGRWLVLGPIDLKDDAKKSMTKHRERFTPRDRKADVPQVGAKLHGLDWRRADGLEGGAGLYLIAIPIHWPDGRERANLQVRITSPGGALLWDGDALKPICEVAVDQPWLPPGQEVRSKTFDIGSGKRSCIYGMIYVPTDENATTTIDIVNADTGQSLNDVLVDF